MQLLENNYNTKTNQPLNDYSNNSKADYSTPNQPKLTMIWVEEYQEGCKRLIAKWIVS